VARIRLEVDLVQLSYCIGRNPFVGITDMIAGVLAVFGPEARHALQSSQIVGLVVRAQQWADDLEAVACQIPTGKETVEVLTVDFLADFRHQVCPGFPEFDRTATPAYAEARSRSQNYNNQQNSKQLSHNQFLVLRPFGQSKKKCNCGQNVCSPESLKRGSGSAGDYPRL